MKLRNLIVIVLFTIAAAFPAVAYIDQHMQIMHCADRGKMMHLPTKYSAVSGCYMWTKDGWRPVAP